MSQLKKCICKNCGKDFQEYVSRILDGRGIYCSKECANKGQETYSMLICKQCGKEFKAFKYTVGSREFCSKECKNKYIKANSNSTKYGRFFRIFSGMQVRCNTSQTLKDINNYQNKDIQCLWKDFNEFKNDMYKTYLKRCEEIGEKNVSIDRINNNGSYFKENCRWASPTQQTRNRKNSIQIIFKGEKMNYYEFAGLIGRSTTSVYKHLKKGKTPKEIYKFSLEFNNKGIRKDKILNQ